MIGESASIGTRVAEERKLRGLTQRQLAERAHVSLSLLRKVEQGTVPASPAFTSATARALGVGPQNCWGSHIRAKHQRITASSLRYLRCAAS